MKNGVPAVHKALRCRNACLEVYLFEDVRRRFHKKGKLDAFDLFSIVAWKSKPLQVDTGPETEK